MGLKICPNVILIIYIIIISVLILHSFYSIIKYSQNINYTK